LKPHQTSREEISNLLAIVERDTADAERDRSPDWRFGIAYKAALKLCTILLFPEGYRPGKKVLLDPVRSGKLGNSMISA
jgi:hypothetical protein